ncbi:MAG: hypothetical protein KIB51_09670 [Dysgonomonas mossii]|nr:hypothetical protein [Dysgonomonas mossii]
MKTIYKYPINLTTEKQRLCLPENSQLLSVQMQNEKLCVWALIDESQPMSMVRFHIFGTCDNLPDDLNTVFLGTVQDGIYVWHVFYERL